MNIKYYTELALSVPKTLYWNCKWYGMKGFLCPVLIHYNTYIVNKGQIIPPPFVRQHFSSRIGFCGSFGISTTKRQVISVSKGCTLHFKGRFSIGYGGVVRIENSGCVCLGTNFNANKNFSIFCNKSISFGNDVLIGWNVSVRDNDGHNIYRGLVPKCNIKEVLINNHVWIAAEVHILKGAVICDGSVVGYRATVFDQFSESNVLIGGYPAKVIQRNIKWEQ